MLQSGCGEEFGEYEMLCNEINDEMMPKKEEEVALFFDKNARKERLQRSGEDMREKALNLREVLSRSIVTVKEGVGVVDGNSSSKKRQSGVYVESHRVMSEALEAL